MKDCALGAVERFHGASDQILAGLEKHLDGDVIGDRPFYQPADEIESACEAEGNPTSISLSRMPTSASKNS